MTTNVNENRRRPGAWKVFLLLAIAAGVSTPLYFSKYGTLCTVLMAIVTGLLLFLAVVFFWKKYSFRDLFIETDEEKAKKEEHRKRREERKRERAEWFKHTTAFYEGDSEKPSAEKQTVAETVPEPPKQEEAKETKETTSGYAIGDVYFTLPVSCIGNYVGTTSSAIKTGKLQLAHGLVLDDKKQIKMSLKEMVKFGYKAPKGFKINLNHDTLVPTVFKYDTAGNYRVDVPSGFAIITSGENAGEMLPVDISLIENL
jgi:hypothetical protein